MRTAVRSVRAALARLPQVEGAELAALVGQLTRPEVLWDLSDAERLEVVKATVRADAWMAAMRARTVGAVHASVLDQVSAEGGGTGVQRRQFAERRVAVEVSLVLGVSLPAADRELDLALDLAEFPRLGRALAAGDLDVPQARVILAGLRDLHSCAGGAGDVDTSDESVRFAHRSELLTGLLGPDDSPEGDEFDPDEPVTDAGPDGRPYPLFRELDRDGVTLWGIPPAKLRAIVSREAARLDADYLAARAERDRADRRVDYQDHADATSSLHLRGATEGVAAAYRNVDDAARTARQHGDPRTLDQLRADITIGWLTEGAYGTLILRRSGTDADVASDAEIAAVGPRDELIQARPDGPLVHVTVAATTLLGLDDEPATLHGPRGPVPLPADLAREIAHRRGARWRRLLYDPGTGIATDLSPAYRPPPRMADFVRTRDGHQSRFPTSGATRLELDHVREYRRNQPSVGGPTCPANLAAAGKRDHQLKTDRLIQVSGDANQQLTYTTPSGRHYVSYPPAVARPSEYAAGSDPPF
ncbi:MAG: hypothetical protein ACJ71T_09230 [Actinomycetales bacterium]